MIFGGIARGLGMEYGYRLKKRNGMCIGDAIHYKTYV
jgi:hypothetical protein